MNQSILAMWFEVSIEIIPNCYKKYVFRYFAESSIVAYV